MKNLLSILAVASLLVAVPFASAQQKGTEKASKPACCKGKGKSCAMTAKKPAEAKKAAKGCTKCEKADKVSASKKKPAKKS